MISSVLFLALIPGDLGGDFLAMAKAKCAQCHSGTDAKGGFNFVLDLKRVANDPTKVSPGSLDCDLWRLVASGNMPPNGSPTGPLSQEQKTAVSAWILGGCPPPSEPLAQSDEQPTSSPGWFDRTLIWLGKFHLLLLHFPVVLLLGVAVCEGWRLWADYPLAKTLTLACLTAGAPLSVLTAVLGWLLALGSYGAGSPGTLMVHRWLGTFLASLACLALVRVRREADKRTWATAGILIGLGLLVVVTAHLGGLMVHGANFLEW